MMHAQNAVKYSDKILMRHLSLKLERFLKMLVCDNIAFICSKNDQEIQQQFWSISAFSAHTVFVVSSIH